MLKKQIDNSSLIKDLFSKIKTMSQDLENIDDDRYFSDNAYSKQIRDIFSSINKTAFDISKQKIRTLDELSTVIELLKIMVSTEELKLENQLLTQISNYITTSRLIQTSS